MIQNIFKFHFDKMFIMLIEFAIHHTLTFPLEYHPSQPINLLLRGIFHWLIGHVMTRRVITSVEIYLQAVGATFCMHSIQIEALSPRTMTTIPRRLLACQLQVTININERIEMICKFSPCLQLPGRAYIQTRSHP